MKTSKQRRRVVGVVGDDDLLQSLHACNLWDCVGLGPGWQNSTRLFGNANIGNLHLTNLQVPAGLPGGDQFVIMNWYVRTNVTDSDPAVTRTVADYMRNTYATLIVAERYRWCAPLAQLLENVRRPIWPVIVGSRQTINVQVDTFGGIADRVRAIAGNYPGPQGLVWIHLEGLRIPVEQLAWDSSSGVAEDDPTVRDRWIQLQAKVMRMVTAKIEGHVDTATHIARWLMSMSNDPAQPGEARAQLQALADGVMEHRWRPERSPGEAMPEGDE